MADGHAVASDPVMGTPPVASMSSVAGSPTGLDGEQRAAIEM